MLVVEYKKKYIRKGLATLIGLIKVRKNCLQIVFPDVV